jgi:hypothetical protein
VRRRRGCVGGVGACVQLSRQQTRALRRARWRRPSPRCTTRSGQPRLRRAARRACPRGKLRRPRCRRNPRRSLRSARPLRLIRRLRRLSRPAASAVACLCRPSLAPSLLCAEGEARPCPSNSNSSLQPMGQPPCASGSVYSQRCCVPPPTCHPISNTRTHTRTLTRARTRTSTLDSRVYSCLANEAGWGVCGCMRADTPPAGVTPSLSAMPTAAPTECAGEYQAEDAILEVWISAGAPGCGER